MSEVGHFLLTLRSIIGQIAITKLDKVAMISLGEIPSSFKAVD